MKRTVFIISCVMLAAGVAQATPPLLDPPPVVVVEARAPDKLQAGEDKIKCTVRFIHALAKKGPTDKALEPIQKKLKSLPFQSYKLLDKAKLTLTRGKTRQTPVPNGAKMSLMFIEKLLEGKDRLKLRLQVKVPPKVKNLVGTMPNRATWPAVIMDHKGGKLVIALTCHAK
jgi:hypothetical protein